MNFWAQKDAKDMIPKTKLINTQNRQSKQYTFSIENGTKNYPETEKAVKTAIRIENTRA
jgi:hypothetical protein